jgi:hypothetical protein
LKQTIREFMLRRRNEEGMKKEWRRNEEGMKKDI